MLEPGWEFPPRLRLCGLLSYTESYTCFCVQNRKAAAVATNLAIDDALITEAQEIGGHKTKKEAVTAALREYIQRRKQLEILDLFGAIDFDPTYDYKAERRRDNR